MLDALGSEDFSTKITDIFYSYTFTSNFTIISGIVKGWKELKDRGYKLPTRTYLRPTLQHINALGGGVLLDIYTEKEIKKIMVDYVTMLYEGKNTLVMEDDGVEYEDEVTER